jgi:hypothetical protein
MKNNYIYISTPCVRNKTCHASCSNLEKIKSEAVWNDESQSWKLPELIITRTKLPPAGMLISEIVFYFS